MPVRNFLENANVLDHKIHGEIDVPASIQDHLALSFMNKVISLRYPDGFVSRFQIHASFFRRHQRLTQGSQMHRSQVVGQNF